MCRAFDSPRGRMDETAGDGAPVAPSARAAIGWALTGRWLPDDAAAPGWAAPSVVAWLAEHGWDGERLAGRRARARSDGQAWPAAVPAAWRGGLGAAQFAAALRAVVAELRLDHEAPLLRDPTAPPGRDDQRLLNEVPPHHGRVG